MAAPTPAPDWVPFAPEWVSFIHPAIAAVGLVLAFMSMRRGLVIRDARVKRQPVPALAPRRHVSLARPAVILLVVSFGLGLLSAVFLRGFKPLDTTHGWLALAAAVCFAGTGLIGTGLTKDKAKRRGLHVAFSLLGLMIGFVAALTGIELLP
jgi:cytochrome bd-type quinol oxidase subunit 2